VHVFRSVTTSRWVVRAVTTTERGYRTQADARRTLGRGWLAQPSGVDRDYWRLEK
jgi:hypothetical protein